MAAVIPSRSCPSNAAYATQCRAHLAGYMSPCLLSPHRSSIETPCARRGHRLFHDLLWAAPSSAIASSSAPSSWSTVWPCGSGHVCFDEAVLRRGRLIWAWSRPHHLNILTSDCQDGETIGAVTGSPSDNVSGSAVPLTKATRLRRRCCNPSPHLLVSLVSRTRETRRHPPRC